MTREGGSERERAKSDRTTKEFNTILPLDEGRGGSTLSVFKCINLMALLCKYIYFMHSSSS